MALAETLAGRGVAKKRVVAEARPKKKPKKPFTRWRTHKPKHGPDGPADPLRDPKAMKDALAELEPHGPR